MQNTQYSVNQGTYVNNLPNDSISREIHTKATTMGATVTTNEVKTAEETSGIKETFTDGPTAEKTRKRPRQPCSCC